MSAAVHRVVDPALVRILSLAGQLVVLPFALVGRRRH
jgi:hypothetical protein